jgi:hypothetical protein
MAPKWYLNLHMMQHSKYQNKHINKYIIISKR